MLHMDGGIEVVGENDISCNNNVLCCAWPALQSQTERAVPFVHNGALGHACVLTVVKDRKVEHVRILNGPAHDFVVLNAKAVIRNGDNALIFKGTNGSEALAGHANGQAARLIDVNKRVACDRVPDSANGAGVVCGRARIGHADHGGVATCRGGPRTAGNVLLVRLSRFPKVDMDVNKSRADNESTCINLFSIADFRFRWIIGDLAVSDKEIGYFIPLIGRVYNASVGDEDKFAHDAEVDLAAFRQR